MEIDSCIQGRRSVRTFKEEAVPKEKIEIILEAGVWAASGMNRQPWRFIVIEDKNVIKFVSDETKKAVREAMPAIGSRFDTKEDIICYNAPVLILICTEVDRTFGQINLRDSVLAGSKHVFESSRIGIGNMLHGVD